MYEGVKSNMYIELHSYNSLEAQEKFLIKNGIENFDIQKCGDKIKINATDINYSEEELEIITRHFSFFDIFHWSSKGIENVILWEKPDRIKDVMIEFYKIFNKAVFNIVTSIEARGFILGGMFCHELNKPFLAIRKYKKIYDSLPGQQISYLNWKNHIIKETKYQDHWSILFI